MLFFLTKRYFGQDLLTTPHPSKWMSIFLFDRKFGFSANPPPLSDDVRNLVCIFLFMASLNCWQGQLTPISFHLLEESLKTWKENIDGFLLKYLYWKFIASPTVLKSLTSTPSHSSSLFETSLDIFNMGISILCDVKVYKDYLPLVDSEMLRQ